METTTTYPDLIRRWVIREYPPDIVERVFQDMLDVATGTRPGNAFERGALRRILPCYPPDTDTQ